MIKKMITYFVLFFIALFLGLFIYLLILSPGKIEAYSDNNGKILDKSLAEKIFVEIGGIKQGMFIRSKNVENPVLLYLHGGPSFPNYFLFDKFEPGLEDFFTVCYWEQRGGGLSFNAEVPLESMNFNQLTQDAIEVTNYLRKRFGKDKIYIMAHSGGTPIALCAVASNPELYSAYIAMAQITNQANSEVEAYRYMLRKFKENNNEKAVEELLNFNVLEKGSNISGFFRSAARDKYMHQLGIGTMRNMHSIFLDVFLPVWTCRAYTLNEKINIWRSKFFFLPKTNLTSELLNTDFSEKVIRVEVPIYFLSGKYDLTVNIDLSRAYYEKIQAPIKGFYTFKNSAHSPLFEEPDKVKEIIEKDVLTRNNSLAD